MWSGLHRLTVFFFVEMNIRGPSFKGWSILFCFCIQFHPSFSVSFSVFTFSFRAGGGGWAHAGAHKVGFGKSLCACVIVSGTHQTESTIRASNPGVSMIRRHAHASSQSLWQAQYIVPRKPFGGVLGPVSSASVAVCAIVFGWDQCRRKQQSNRHKISMIDHRPLPS